MQWLVKIADMHVSKDPEDVIQAFGLGSCLGIILYDPEAKTGGLLHCLLPRCVHAPDDYAPQAKNPLMYADQGIPLLLAQVKAAGGVQERLRVYVAGGASFTDDAKDLFSVGIRNFVAACNVLRGLKLPLTAKEVGGRMARTLSLQVGTGRVWVATRGEERDL